MAYRIIRKIGDDILKKPSREVEKIDGRIISLLNDMRETLEKANGVGLAAPQVGVLRRVAIINTDDDLIELINPSITSCEGEVVGVEGCLSLPGKYAEVARPEKVTVEALNRNGEKIDIVGEGLMARALCHEIDHLNGTLFVEKVIRFLDDDTNE